MIQPLFRYYRAEFCRSKTRISYINLMCISFVFWAMDFQEKLLSRFIDLYVKSNKIGGFLKNFVAFSEYLNFTYLISTIWIVN